MKNRTIAVVSISILLLVPERLNAQEAHEGIVVTPKNSPSSYRPFTLKRFDDYLNDLVFTNQERILLNKAEEAMNDAIESDELIANLCTSPPSLNETARRMIHFQECLPREYRLGETSVILSQLAGIAMITGIFGSFTVVTHLYDRADDTLGEAKVGTVDLGLECSPETGFRFRDPGEFEIWINRRYLPQTTPRELAGTILHEIFHNLGHSHPDDGYDRDWQIYALTDQLGQGWIRNSCFKHGNKMKMAIPAH